MFFKKVNCQLGAFCDLYTAYLENQYQIIQEQVAQGTGAQLDALAYYSGCEKQAVPSFRKTLYANYDALFGSNQDAGILRNQILGLIETTPSLSESCSIELISESQNLPLIALWVCITNGVVQS